MCILWSWSGAPGRGFDFTCASCGRGPELDLTCAYCSRGPDPRERVSMLKVQFVVKVWSPGKRLRSYWGILWSRPGAPGKGFDLNVHLVVVVRSPGKGRRFKMCIWRSFPGAPGQGFDLNCASCGRGGPEPREGVSILNVHLAVVVRSPGKGASILNVHLVVVVRSPGKGLRI